MLILISTLIRLCYWQSYVFPLSLKAQARYLSENCTYYNQNYFPIAVN